MKVPLNGFAKSPQTNHKSPTSSPPKKGVGSTRKAASGEGSNIPLVSVLKDRKTMDLAKKYLADAHRLKGEIDKREAELDLAKAHLAEIAMSHAIPGMRFGEHGIRVGGYISRSTFDKDRAVQLMADAGVSPEEIASCYGEGKKYLDIKLQKFT